MDRPTVSICWLQDGARFEEQEGEHWIPMRASQTGLIVHVPDRRYCGCMAAWRGDSGRKVRVAASDLFDAVTVEAR
jgi:hypothetical protein